MRESNFRVAGKLDYASSMLARSFGQSDSDLAPSGLWKTVCHLGMVDFGFDQDRGAKSIWFELELPYPALTLVLICLVIITRLITLRCSLIV